MKDNVKNFFMTPKFVFQILINPHDFVEVAVKHDITPDKYPDAQRLEKERNNRRDGCTQSANGIRRKIASGLVFSCIIPLMSLLIFFKYRFEPAKFYFLFSAFFVVWSQAGRIGWELRTLGRKTLSDQVDNNWHWILVIVSQIFLVLGIFYN